MLVVALGEPEVPVTCCAETGVAASIVTAGSAPSALPGDPEPTFLRGWLPRSPRREAAQPSRATPAVRIEHCKRPFRTAVPFNQRNCADARGVATLASSQPMQSARGGSMRRVPRIGIWDLGPIRALRIPLSVGGPSHVSVSPPPRPVPPLAALATRPAAATPPSASIRTSCCGRPGCSVDDPPPSATPADRCLARTRGRVRVASANILRSRTNADARIAGSSPTSRITASTTRTKRKARTLAEVRVSGAYIWSLDLARSTHRARNPCAYIGRAQSS
jgi:hypothetical protein